MNPPFRRLFLLLMAAAALALLSACASTPSHASLAQNEDLPAPDTTTAARPFTAAIDSPPVSLASTVSRGAATETIPPSPASARIALLRNATTRAPSSSDSAPETTAAAISP